MNETTMESKDKDYEYLWSTRGLQWDFRLRHKPSIPCRDWLSVYEDAFNRSDDLDFFAKKEVLIDGRSELCVALRFPDPEGRRDEATRVIPHEFVVFGELAERIQDNQQGKELLWSIVKEEYDRIYALENPPQEPLESKPGQKSTEERDNHDPENENQNDADQENGNQSDTRRDFFKYGSLLLNFFFFGGILCDRQKILQSEQRIDVLQKENHHLLEENQRLLEENRKMTDKIIEFERQQRQLEREK
jgi:hypothetical protein